MNEWMNKLCEIGDTYVENRGSTYYSFLNVNKSTENLLMLYQNIIIRQNKNLFTNEVQ